jgi:hypothetical protein
MSAVAELPEVKGVPAGLVAEPINASADKVRGVPEGLTAEPIEQTAKPVAEPKAKKPAEVVQGVPAGVTAHPVSPQQLQINALTKKAQEHPYSLSVDEHQQLERLKLQNPAVAERDMTDAFAYAQSQGWSEQEAQQYANSDSQQRMFTRAGKVLGDKFQRFTQAVGNTIGAPHLPERLRNPFFETDEQRKKSEERIQAEKLALSTGAAPALAPYGFGDLGPKVGKLAGALDEHLAHTIDGLASPTNIALLLASHKLAGMPEGTPVTVQKVARTTQQLANAGFTAQMAEGAGQALKSAWNNFVPEKGKERNVPEGVGYMLDALVNGTMAASGVHESVAHETVKAGLDKTTEDILPGRKFADLSDSEQAIVINKYVEESPEAQRAAGASEAQMRRDAKRLNYKHNRALAEAWNPNAAARAIREIHEQRAATERQTINEWMEEARKKQEQQHESSLKEYFGLKREERDQQRQAAATSRWNAGRMVAGIAAKREQVWNERNKVEAEQAPDKVPHREVDSVVSDNGQIVYPAFYLGEENAFAVAPGETGHSVYRQTPRGVEWLGADGNFREEPEQVYASHDPAEADVMARLTALQTQTASLAEEGGATAEQIEDADRIADIRRDLVNGDIDAREAQRRAGISEKSKLPDEFAAARDGKLNGPFHESSADGYYEGLRSEAGVAGLSEEETNTLLNESGLLARQQTQGILDHVYRPGDYITAKSGTKWTLDAKGMLHPDDGGQPIPLIKRGLYSNTAMQLAESGRVGYGTVTREQRRSDNARRRQIATDIDAHQAEVDREMRLAIQQEGLQPAAEAEPRPDIEEKRARQERITSRPPRAPESQIGGIVRTIFKAPTSAKSVIHAIAERGGVSDEEVMRLALANDPERSQTTEARVARLEVGDTVSDDFRKDRPWKVEQGKDGSLYLRSGNASPLKLDRLNPSERIRQLVERGQVSTDRPEFTSADVERAAFEAPHYVRFEERLAKDVKDRAEGRAKAPEPRSEKQAQQQAVAAVRRSDAAEAVATRAVVDATNPPPEATVEQAERAAVEATGAVKVAEEGFAQAVEAQSKAEPKDSFPPRAPATVGLRGEQGVITQNSREFPFHYELLPIDGLVTSHVWNGGKMEVNEEYPPALQPRTVSENESKENALRAERRRASDNGRASGYNFREYGDKTINGTMGPAIVEEGGRVVGGNTRIAIMRRHLENLAAIGDPEEREASQYGFRAAMRKLAEEHGITNYPDDGKEYVVVRMLDKPIADTREAADLGRLFNKPVSVQITKSARGVSFAKSLDKPILEEIARRVEAYDGLLPAMQADPEFFRSIVTDKFGIEPVEFADWFDDVPGRGLILNDQSQFEKTMLGAVIKDTAILNRIEGKTPYRALVRALGYMVKMGALPHRDIVGKITEAAQAAAETILTDPGASFSNDRWLATYHPDQAQFLGMETDTPPEPDRVVEALWRALHASDAAVPRVFNDRLKSFLGDESSKALNMFSAEREETPSEAFNRAFKRELTEVKFSRKDAQEGIGPEEYDQSLKNREMSDAERDEFERGGRGQSPEPSEGAVAEPPSVEPKKAFARPPAPPIKRSVAERDMGITKAEQGYVTPAKLKEFLEAHPATKESASTLMRTARMMAEYVYDIDPPVGVDRKQALDWVLKERLAGIERGNLKTKAGQYVDPNIEKGFGERVMKLHQAANPTTFIHEFAHVIFPMLSEQDMKDIDTIRGKAGHVWDGSRGTLTGKVYADLSEKLAHGLEQFLRDENPTGFTHEVKAVLAKVKEIMRKVYMKFAGDPLSEFQNTEESRGVFAKMFGITDFDVQDEWRNEVKKARAEEKKMKKPSEEPHPIQRQAADAGASGIRNTFSGKVEDSAGPRIDPRQPVAVFVFPDANRAATYWSTLATGDKPAELIQGDGGEWGVRFNTKAKVPSNVLYQDVPRKHPGIELEEKKKRLAATPDSAPMLRKMLQAQIQGLENEIRAKYGAETEPAPVPPDYKQVVQEAKNAKTDAVRKATDGEPSLHKAGGFTEVPKPPNAPKFANVPTRTGRIDSGRPVAGVHVPASLAEVRPVNLEPLRDPRGTPVGRIVGEAFDAKAWADNLRNAGLPENLPPPTWALDSRTAEKLIFPGQPEVAQTALSALEQGDGAVVATATGTGKTYTNAAIAREWRLKHPDAKILVITKNAKLLKSTQNVALNTFGYEIDGKIPDKDAPTGTYATTYARMIRDEAANNTKWDLVLADESGEARNWFQEDNQQGKALMAITANAAKAVYFSATPFHSPMEYGYLTKLNLWPKNGFDRWIENNFAHEKINDKIVARLDPAKQAKLRQQLIERGQLISQAISYEGFTAHFGVVPVTDAMKRGLDRIHEGFARAKSQLISMKKKGLAEKIAAFEATYTKAFLERERLPQAIDLAHKAREAGWQVAIFSETSSEDLFRRPRERGMEPSTYQQLDDAMGGGLSKIIPPFPNIYDRLKEEFGEQIGDYSGRGNSLAEREVALNNYLKGETPVLYTTFAAGGIGVSLHDADFPELGVKGGDKPRVHLFLGPPYSGVLLEQSMGRGWRFGVKSDHHAVFLATDSEPDVRLMQQKVGPRMKALRASVLGEKDSLANVMATYTDEEKVRARQEALAYQEGNEANVDAASYQVRSKSRNVGINDWSMIGFPPAETAKNKGMKYGADVVGGDWSTLYQDSEKLWMQPPDSPETAAGKKEIDKIGNEVATGRNVPEALQGLNPADRDAVIGLSAATATREVDVPVDRDKRAAARQAMEAGLRNNSFVPYQGVTLSQELGIENIARLEGKPGVGLNLKRMNRSYRAEGDVLKAKYWNALEDVFKKNKLTTDDATTKEVSLVLEGKRVSDNPAITKAASELADLMEVGLGDAVKAQVVLRTKAGNKLTYSESWKDRNYFPRRIDWDHPIVDPVTGEMSTLREVMKPKFDEAKRERMLKAIPELKAHSYQQIMDYLDRNDPRAPLLSNIHFAREINFPYYRRDYSTLVGYFDQLAEAVSAARHFGPESEKLNGEIRKLRSVNGINTINSMFRSVLEPQGWDDWTTKLYNAAIAYEAASKMTFAVAKLPTHLLLVPLAMDGRVMPMVKAIRDFALHPKMVMENAAFVGTLANQLDAADMMYGEHSSPLVRQILKKELFEGAYKIVKTISGQAGKVYLEQYAMNDLKRGGTDAEDARRLVRDTFLIGDHAIDEAIQRGSFAPDDLARAQTAFANLTTFSADPLQMPQMARMEISRSDSQAARGLKRAVRLTYALQSFTLKATSLLREKAYDEMIIHHNFRMLPYLAIASPIAGEMLQFMGQGLKHFVHVGAAGLTGQKAKKDAWDEHFERIKDLVENPTALKAAKELIDAYTLGWGLEIVKLLAVPLMDLAAGQTTKADGYWFPDLMEHIFGSFWTDIYKTGDELRTLQEIEAGKKKSPAEKKLTKERSVVKYVEGQFPALRQIPWIDDFAHPPKKTEKKHY